MSGRLGSLPTSRNTQNCSKNYRMLRNSSQRLDDELDIVNFWSQTLYTKPPSVWQKSAQKQRDYFERMVLSCTVVAQWPDKGAEMGQFGRRSHIWCTHHQCHIFGAHPSAIGGAQTSAIKIPSEMEVAPRYNCWHCWHCWHGLHCWRCWRCWHCWQGLHSWHCWHSLHCWHDV